MTVTVSHRIPREDIAFGLVRIGGSTAGATPADLENELDTWIARRREPLDPAAEQRRRAGRDILRNGKYKPTGRGKPASEYLLRAVNEEFPRLGGAVDANNLMSLKHLVAISVWDLDLAVTDTYEMRLGAAGESYVFNAAGQELALEDLVAGCGLLPGGASNPIITPIKDSLATKLRAESHRVAGCIYFPLATGDLADLKALSDEFLGWLLSLGSAAQGAAAVCGPGETVSF